LKGKLLSSSILFLLFLKSRTVIEWIIL